MTPRARAILTFGVCLFSGALLLAQARGKAPAPQQPQRTGPFTAPQPLGFEPVAIPDDNPLTWEKVELGKQLYFDKRLSADSTIACASCHDPTKGWADAKPFSPGVGGKLGARSSPPILNAAYSYVQFWDGRAKTLEEQALGPIQNPVEMGEKLDNVAARLNGIAGYKTQFQKVFGADASGPTIAKAIAAFERTIISGDAPFDRYQAGDKTAMTAAQIRGFDLFKGKAQCTNCHVGFTLSDSLFHNVGVGYDKPNPDLGRFVLTNNPKDRGAFKTPMLRDVALTAPYMHDGSEATLESVMELYNRGGNKNPFLDPKIKPLNLTAAEKADVVEFMKALTGTPLVVKPPTLPK